MNDLWNVASGEYVAVINSDDEFLPAKLERQLAFMEARPNLAASFTWAEIVGNPVKNSATGVPRSPFRPKEPIPDKLAEKAF